ncbi:epididymal secretory E1 [Brachionus plicatilis]|uniref:Epididymal secretory E1 n=1 Tax=Brachionus plicatilis TaxID=10195 RepID=A0A3M7S8D9_BRAPC|nr:epididymal secretory E1 [Brachionus plicatilis]
MFKLLILTIAVALFGSSSAQITWKDCGSKNGVLTDIVVEGCTSSPCILKKGTDASMKATFDQRIASTSIKAKVSGVIFGIPIPFPLPDDNACNLNANCPAQANSQNSVELKLPILKEYPSLSVDCRIHLKEDFTGRIFTGFGMSLTDYSVQNSNRSNENLKNKTRNLNYNKDLIRKLMTYKKYFEY